MHEKTIQIPLSEIRVDGEMQARAGMDWDYVNQIAADLGDGVQMAHPLEVYHDGKYYWLVDGFHRYHAGRQADGLPDPWCNVTKGSKAEAEYAALSANTSHGKPLTQSEKHRNAINALQHPMAKGQTVEQIARHVGLGKSTVQRILKRLTSDEQEPVAEEPEPDNSEPDSSGQLRVTPGDKGKSTIIKDKLGNLITSKTVQEAFSVGTRQIREMQAAIAQTRKQLKTAAVGPAGRHLVRQQIDADLSNAWRAMGHGLPYCLVPEGVKAQDSRWDCGWMNRADYEALPPEFKYE